MVFIQASHYGFIMAALNLSAHGFLMARLLRARCPNPLEPEKKMGWITLCTPIEPKSMTLPSVTSSTCLPRGRKHPSNIRLRP